MDEMFTANDGIEIALHKNGHSMKKNRQILKARSRLSLGAVSSCTKNTKETAATVAALLATGQVRVKNNGRFMRARVC